MIEHFVSEQEARVLRASPLGAHLDTFDAELVKGGYRRFTGPIRLRVLKDLGSWLEAEGAGPRQDVRTRSQAGAVSC